MRTIYLFSKKMKTREKAQHYLARRLNFPAYYGKNLDALYDLLTEPMEQTHIVLLYTDALKTALGDYGERMLTVFSDAANVNDKLTVEIRPGRGEK